MWWGFVYVCVCATFSGSSSIALHPDNYNIEAAPAATLEAAIITNNGNNSYNNNKSNITNNDNIGDNNK
jgi:hypothetical protein